VFRDLQANARAGNRSPGIGSAIYRMRCPRLIKSFADASEFVRIQALAIWNEMMNIPAPGPQFENGALIPGPM
jgi:hypothetical protein